jgi:hypothetical protein
MVLKYQAVTNPTPATMKKNVALVFLMILCTAVYFPR